MIITYRVTTLSPNFSSSLSTTLKSFFFSYCKSVKLILVALINYNFLHSPHLTPSCTLPLALLNHFPVFQSSGLASGVSAGISSGNMESNSMFSLFNVTVYLTTKGIRYCLPHNCTYVKLSFLASHHSWLTFMQGGHLLSKKKTATLFLLTLLFLPLSF